MAVGAAYGQETSYCPKLSAIESLAGVEILCSDKTGTLTKNKLSLHEPYTVEGVEPDDLMLTACLAASRKKKGLDAIDKAFLKSLINYQELKLLCQNTRLLNSNLSILSPRKLLLLLNHQKVKELFVLRVPHYSS